MNDTSDHALSQSVRPLHCAALPEPVPLFHVDLSEQPPWALGPCIRPGDCVYFVGRPGHGKSTLVADLVAAMLTISDKPKSALAGAWKVNNDFIDHNRPVAIINAETSGPEDWARMLHATLIQRGINPSSDANYAHVMRYTHFYQANDLPIDRDNLLSSCTALAHAFAHAGYGCVIIDPVYDAFKPRDNADATWVFDGLSPFVRVLKAHNILSIMIAHPSAASRSYGTKGGSSMDQAFAPFGSEKQSAVIDALFAVNRKPSVNIIEVIKLKSRRAGSWIQNRQALILTFGNDGGYASYSGNWEYENPNKPVLEPAAIKLLTQLPVTERFYLESGKDGRKFRHKDFRTYLSLYYLPYDYLRVEQEGRRKVYIWTDTGREARERALKHARASRKEKAS